MRVLVVNAGSSTLKLRILSAQDELELDLAGACLALPDVPHVACFDNSFHATLTGAARTYAPLRPWRERWGLHRFGFHGLSHAWAAARGPAVADVPAAARMITCHLGAGASLCAVVHGRSVDTTMGFTPLDGIVMATRSGAVDPGLLLWLLTDGGLSAGELTEGVEQHAGLAGLAGTGDMRQVLAARATGDPDAALACVRAGRSHERRRRPIRAPLRDGGRR